MKRAVYIGLVVLLALFALQAGATELLQNGSFQTGDFTDWTLGTTQYGTAGAGYPIVGQWPLDSGINAWVGNVGDATDEYRGYQGATLSQVFTAPGLGIETFSIDLAAKNVPGYYQLEAGLFLLLVDGNTIGSFDIGELAPNQLFTGSLSATAALSAGQHTFEIAVERDATTDENTPLQFVTDASIDYQVPEPTSLVLMASGGLGIAGILRRKLFYGKSVPMSAQ